MVYIRQGPGENIYGGEWFVIALESPCFRSEFDFQAVTELTEAVAIPQSNLSTYSTWDAVVLYDTVGCYRNWHFTVIGQHEKGGAGGNLDAWVWCKMRRSATDQCPYYDRNILPVATNALIETSIGETRNAFEPTTIPGSAIYTVSPIKCVLPM